MVRLSIEGEYLLVDVEGLHKLWACRSHLRIPLKHVVSVEQNPEAAHRWWHGWKALGTDIPGVFAAGLFRLNGKWVFWDVKNPDNAIELKLQDEGYEDLILEVEDPAGTAEMIREAITSR